LFVDDKSDDSYYLYAMTRNWSENDATWRHASPGLLWERAGALGGSDRAVTPLGTLSAENKGFVTITLNAAGLEILQQWIDDPEMNFGITIQNYAGASNGVTIASSESVNTANRPKLSITYLPG
jgi:hypothetical protein